ncbi:Os03g0116000 [Oryza sativa Japonica Group]|uniref:Os03g0116000 protein n=1 Tax=Oryza sativa subsp. japonica TaxID=39947 RepID=Q0DVR8_ORYSJ|nr:Os03g0116000 [Oryza sativa Japonica Group]|eukprot:NP_001048756.1 Os03g0116000 [Oryza sativa Japonica Group]
MAFSARRSLASGLSRHLSRRLHPSVSHLLPSHHDDHSENPSPPAQPPPLPSALRSPSRSQALGLPLPFGLLHASRRSLSTSPRSNDELDASAEVLSDAASSVSVPADVLADAAASVPVSAPAPFPGEVAAAAADSFAPVAALQHLIDGVHSLTGLNWWACIALTSLLIRTLTVPLLLNQMKATVKLNAMRPEIEAINLEMRTISSTRIAGNEKSSTRVTDEGSMSTDPQSMLEGKRKLGELFLRHGVTPLTPLKGLFIQAPIFMSFFFAISNMVEKVPSFKGGGIYWFTDLTTPDELLILPMLTSLTFLVTVELNMQDGMEGNPMLKTMKNFSRVMAVLTIPFTMSFPKAIFFYWVTSNLFSLGYGFVLRKPAVRSFLDLPPIETQFAPAQQPTFNLFGASKSVPAAGSSIAESDRSSSVLSQRFSDLENRAKSRRESQD